MKLSQVMSSGLMLGFCYSVLNSVKVMPSRYNVL